MCTLQLKLIAKQKQPLVPDYSVPDGTFFKPCSDYLTIIPQVRMGSESIAHEAEGQMGY